MKKKESDAGTEKREVLYRAYRPKAFADVVGQEHITEVLAQAVKKGAVAHAYLFCGGRGIGKTSVARIFAKTLGVADADLYEIDAASYRGIEHIRSLREGVHALPLQSPYKFYIIDEAHALTKDAWNAFLKTLEEPPAHVIFVLATTERDKIPETIESRCEVYLFKQPTREVLAHMLIAVAKREGYALERAAADLNATLAEGSFRDALSILQKALVASESKAIDLPLVEKVSGAPKAEWVRAFLAALAEKDASRSLAAVREAVAHNTDPRIFAKLLIHRLRALLIMRFAPDLAPSFLAELTEADHALLQDLSKKSTITSSTLRAFLAAHEEIAYAAIAHLPLELAIMELLDEKTIG